MRRRLALSLCALSVACSTSSKTSRVASDAGGTTGGEPTLVDAASDGGGTGGAMLGPRADAGPDASSTACGVMDVSLAGTKPRVLIVLDRSGSMNPNGNAEMTDRWTGSTQAVRALAAARDDEVDFGLLTFPGEDPCSVDDPVVPVKAKGAADIELALKDLTASGGTPTEEALHRAKDALLPMGATKVSEPSYVFLVTDGAPTCAGGNPTPPPECQPPNSPTSPECLMAQGNGSMTSPAVLAATVDVVKLLAAADIRTHVIGFQTAGTELVDALDQIAAAGATGEPHHQSVSSGSDLETLLQSLVEGALSCAFTPKTQVADAANLTLTLDGKMLSNGKDWSLASDGQTVTLLSDACSSVRSGDGYKLSANVACP